MLNISQISKQVADLKAAQISLDAFEEWFRRESRNVRVWGSRDVRDAVFSIEAVFSEYHFADLDEQATKYELGRAIGPFEESEPQIVFFDSSAWANAGVGLPPSRKQPGSEKNIFYYSVRYDDAFRSAPTVRVASANQYVPMEAVEG